MQDASLGDPWLGVFVPCAQSIFVSAGKIRLSFEKNSIGARLLFEGEGVLTEVVTEMVPHLFASNVVSNQLVVSALEGYASFNSCVFDSLIFILPFFLFPIGIEGAYAHT